MAESLAERTYRASPGLPRGLSVSGSVVLRPLGIVEGAAAAALVERGDACWLAGGPLAFTACEAFIDEGARIGIATAPVPEFRAWGQADAALDAVSAPRGPYASLALDKPRVVGVVNVTSDSFYEGSRTPDAGAAIARGEQQIAEGADIIDVGGASTRPGSSAPDAAEEARRVVPVVRALAGKGVPISIDTFDAQVMRAALDAGATIVNDVTALTADPDALATLARSTASVILMHMQGTPETMQRSPHYGHAAHEIYRYLAARVAACEAAGIPRARIAVDPGIGFGKRAVHNAQLLASAAMFHGTGCAVMVGASRKSFIAKLSAKEEAQDRLAGSLAAVLTAAGQGVQLHRVHDVAATRQALAVKLGATGA
jgi:dihydropteroate synthase